MPYVIVWTRKTKLIGLGVTQLYICVCLLREGSVPYPQRVYCLFVYLAIVTAIQSRGLRQTSLTLVSVFLSLLYNVCLWPVCAELAITQGSVKESETV